MRSDLYEAVGYPSTHYDRSQEVRYQCKDLRAIKRWVLTYLSLPDRKAVLYRHESPYRNFRGKRVPKQRKRIWQGSSTDKNGLVV